MTTKRNVGRLSLAGCALLFLLFSCAQKQADLAHSVAGNWLVVYPEHQLVSQHEREVYGRYQDSLIRLYGLKLVQLSADGGFRQVDSISAPPGRWLLAGNLLKIREGGRGFNPFNSSVSSWKEGELQLAQDLPLENERIRVVWHLRKVEPDSPAAQLFSPEANAWRRKPGAPESRPAMQKRLAAMVLYYSDYFALIDKESSYFSLERIPLPFRFYRHGVGLRKPLPPAFVALFFNEADAETAYGLLEENFSVLQGSFAYAENFVAEYSLFLKRLAEVLPMEVR